MPFYFALKDKYLRIVFVLSFLTLFFLSFVAFVKLQNISSPLIIHFDAYKGIDFFGGKKEIFGILFSAFVMVLVNFLLTDFLYNRERFISYILGFGSLALTILILIGVSVIIFVN